MSYKMILLSLFLLVSCQKSGSDLVFEDINNIGTKNDRAPANLGDVKAELNVADRYYVESVLLQIFSPTSAADKNKLQVEIIERPEFGGPCDPYEPSETTTAAVEFPRLRCLNGISTVLTSTANPMRFSLTTKTCERLVSETTSFTRAMSKIFGNGPIIAPNASSLSSAYSLFYQDENASSAITTALMDLSKKGSDANESWRLVLIALCISPGWQVL